MLTKLITSNHSLSIDEMTQKVVDFANSKITILDKLIRIKHIEKKNNISFLKT